MILAVLSARRAGLDRIRSGFTSRFANRLPIFRASRLPRLPNGRSLSGNAGSVQLDFAWRMRNSVFMAEDLTPSNLSSCMDELEGMPLPAGYRCANFKAPFGSA